MNKKFIFISTLYSLLILSLVIMTITMIYLPGIMSGSSFEFLISNMNIAKDVEVIADDIRRIINVNQQGTLILASILLIYVYINIFIYIYMIKYIRNRD